MTQPPLTDEEKRFAELLPWCGLSIAGDIGPFTCYTTHRGRRVFYRRAPPTSPPTPPQIRQRLRFKLAQHLWSNIPVGQKQLWEQLTKELSLCLTGQNLFMSLALNPDDEALASALNRTGLSLTTPPEIPR